jgi:hypothetical protein
VTEEVRGTLALDLPVSSFDIDLADAARPGGGAAGGGVGPRVRNRAATCRSRSWNVCPALIWQTRDGTVVLIDADGNFVASPRRAPARGAAYR